jgi:death-on-curing protein
VIFLSVEDLLYVAERTIGEVLVRDLGLLDAAAARPSASPFGTDAYPSIHEKAAALLHSIARNHALVDGNKRLALAAAIAFYGVNGWRLTLTNEQAYQLVMDVASGAIDEISDLAAALAPGHRGAPVDAAPNTAQASRWRSSSQTLSGPMRSMSHQRTVSSRSTESE